MKKPYLCLGALSLIALCQQQLLLRRPARLTELRPLPPGHSAAALELRFSRPIDGSSLRLGTKLLPPLPIELQGQGNTWQLRIAAGQAINDPLQLEISGTDRQGKALASSSWEWDPRPVLVGARPVTGGDQLQLWQQQRWQPLSPVHGPVESLQPLGNGLGLATVTASDPMARQVWLLELDQSLRPLRERRLNQSPLVYANLSSDQRGDLLLQGNGVELFRSNGSSQRLKLASSGPLRLVPQGGQLVMPEPEGLALLDLPPLPPRRQFLIGSRDLSSFCPAAGRAVLVRHWPDYRRSLELLEPGRSPRQLWLGSEALAATACAGAGERIWALLLSGISQPQLELLELDGKGKQRRSIKLEGEELEPGTGLHYNPASQKLLLQLRPLAAPNRPQQLPRAVLIDTRSYARESLPGGVRQVGWLARHSVQRRSTLSTSPLKDDQHSR
jgi:hypothetical protein